MQEIVTFPLPENRTSRNPLLTKYHFLVTGVRFDFEVGENGPFLHTSFRHFSVFSDRFEVFSRCLRHFIDLFGHLPALLGLFSREDGYFPFGKQLISGSQKGRSLEP